MEIEIWPSATLFEAGSSLQLTILGHDAARYPGFRHRRLLNRGWHTIFTGGPYDSCLTVPLNIREAGEMARREISPISDVRGSAEFRAQLGRNVLRKFFAELNGVNGNGNGNGNVHRV